MHHHSSGVCTSPLRPAAFAVAFPLVRWALERAVLKVSSRSSCRAARSSASSLLLSVACHAPPRPQPLAAHWVRLPKRHAASAGAAEHKMRRERFAESGEALAWPRPGLE